jgi:hypothetical protein
VVVVVVVVVSVGSGASSSCAHAVSTPKETIAAKPAVAAIRRANRPDLMLESYL